MQTIHLPEGNVLVADLIAATVAQTPDLRERRRYKFEDGWSEPVEVSNREQARQLQTVHFARMCERGELTPRNPLTLVPVAEFLPDKAARCIVNWSDAQAFAAAMGLSLEPEEGNASPPEPLQATPAAIEPNGLTRGTKRRADSLSAVIDLAVKQALDGADWTSVWAELVKLAQSAGRPAPLLGYVEGEGVKYQKDNAEIVGVLSRDALRKRFQRNA